GLGERVDLVETDTKHGYPKLQREAMLRWMRRWLAGKDEAATESMIMSRPVADYRCTPKGQVMYLEGERSVIDLNVELNARLAPALSARRRLPRRRPARRARRKTRRGRPSCAGSRCARRRRAGADWGQSVGRQLVRLLHLVPARQVDGRHAGRGCTPLHALLAR